MPEGPSIVIRGPVGSPLRDEGSHSVGATHAKGPGSRAVVDVRWNFIQSRQIAVVLLDATRETPPHFSEVRSFCPVSR